MGESFDLQITANLLTQLQQQQITFLQFLSEVFNGNSGINYLQMCNALKAYHHQNGGAPEVIAFEITSPQINLATLSGSFGCKFKVSFFFGCDDLHIDKNDTITWQCQINQTNNIIHFVGEEPWNSDAG